jgi:hypothetical protein
MDQEHTSKIEMGPLHYAAYRYRDEKRISLLISHHHAWHGMAFDL